MTLEWRHALDGMDWEELADLYRMFGFKRMTTAMAIFENPGQALESGLIRKT